MKGKHEGKHEDCLVESHKGKHEDRLIENHKGKHEGKHEGKTWRSFDFGRKSWRGNMIESHKENHEDCSTKLFTSI